MDPHRLGERIESAEAIDQLAEPVHGALDKVLPRGALKDVLHGVWLGHPLHPLLTDLPIGFWTSAFVLDLCGKKMRPAADTLVGLGVLSALPTAASGAADWSELNKPERRAGLVHGLANAAATVLFALSYWARRRDRRAKGVLLGMAGSAAATAGGYLGGHLSFRRAAGVNTNARLDGPDEWTAADDVDALVATTPDGATHAIGATCSHLGGPLREGKIDGNCVTCPWHESVFRLDDGSVVHGPATAPQPTFDVRTTDGTTELRRAPDSV